jgi:hypothetical protein
MPESGGKALEFGRIADGKAAEQDAAALQQVPVYHLMQLRDDIGQRDAGGLRPNQ